MYKPKFDNKKLERPDDRKKAKKGQGAQMLRGKNVKPAEEAVKLQQQHVTDITRRNKIIMFSNGTNGADSEVEKCCCTLKQAADLKELEDGLKKLKAKDGQILNVLFDAVENVDMSIQDNVSTTEHSFPCERSDLDSLTVTRSIPKTKKISPAVAFRSHWDREFPFTR